LFVECAVIKYVGSDGETYLSMYANENHDSIDDPPRFKSDM
jgi:hypothetical protein